METYLTFMLANETFAVNVDKVLEVLEQQHITPVPGMPSHFLGITNFRGEILPVANTHKKLNMDLIDDSGKFYVIVFEIEKADKKYSVAATADNVRDVIEVNPTEIKPVPEMGSKFNSSFISGVIRKEENFIMLFKIESIFSDIENHHLSIK